MNHQHMKADVNCLEFYLNCSERNRIAMGVWAVRVGVGRDRFSNALAVPPNNVPRHGQSHFADAIGPIVLLIFLAPIVFGIVSRVAMIAVKLRRASAPSGDWQSAWPQCSVAQRS